ncbi:MAG: HEAT repeat domain-containing protein [Planctomycetes bacterium]|nr:HEAT repeat domain-containing protein [Planctomycetota bacterium]
MPLPSSPQLDSRISRILLACVLFAAAPGCTDGPFFQMKKLNPYIQSQWRKDREKTVVYSQRVNEMRLLRRQIANMPTEEQSRWIAKLTDILQTETSPELRRESVLVLQEVMDRQDAVAAVTPLSQDKNDKVRLTVAQTLGARPNTEAASALMAMATSDSSRVVQLAATESLGKHPTDEVRQFLASKLEDRNPAMQYQASLALKSITGKNYGGDIDAWKRYLAGEDIPEPKASLADSMKSFVPMWR